MNEWWASSDAKYLSFLHELRARTARCARIRIHPQTRFAHASARQERRVHGDSVRRRPRGLLRLAAYRRDFVQYLAVLGEPTDVVLVPDLRPVDVNVEHAAGPFDHRGINAELFLDRLRQTGGRRVVVSFHAVLDTDVHQ